MSNAIVKAALNNMKDIKAFFDEYAYKGKASENGNPFWSLYQGEDTKAPRCAFNWHLSDPKKSWELLEMNLKPYVDTGGTFYLTMSDKAKDNAPSVFKLIDFNPFRNVNLGVNGINGIYTNGGISGTDFQSAVAKEVEIAMLRRDLQDLKNSKQTGIGAIIHPFTSNPNFNPNNFINGVFGLLNNLMNRQMVTNGIPQYEAQTQQQQQHLAQAQEQTDTEVYEYNNEELLIGLEKIRAKFTGVRPEIVLMKLGATLETISDFELSFLLGKLGIAYNSETKQYCIVEQVQPKEAQKASL